MPALALSLLDLVSPYQLLGTSLVESEAQTAAQDVIQRGKPKWLQHAQMFACEGHAEAGDRGDGMLRQTIPKASSRLSIWI